MLKRVLLSLFAAIVLLGLASLEVPTPGSAGQKFKQADRLATSESLVTPAPGFRVDNFNVQRGKGEDGLRDLSRAASVLGGADIAGLQELSGTLFYGLDDQAEQIGDAIGLDYLFAPTSYRWLQAYRGSGLLSRFPVENWVVEVLPKVKGSKAGLRNLIVAEVLIEGQLVTLLVTHLDRRESNQVQLEYVLERFREVEGPVILMADLNTDLSNESLMSLIAEPGVKDAIHESIGQFWRLDWIVTRGFDVIEGGHTPRGISDHAHYWVRLSFTDDQPILN